MNRINLFLNISKKLFQNQKQYLTTELKPQKKLHPHGLDLRF